MTVSMLPVQPVGVLLQPVRLYGSPGNVTSLLRPAPALWANAGRVEEGIKNSFSGKSFPDFLPFSFNHHFNGRTFAQEERFYLGKGIMIAVLTIDA
jgi:hypothetical protein